MAINDKLICFNCKHFDPRKIGGCRAFPEGIPDEILRTNKHDKPIKGQGNDLVYDPVKADKK